MSKTQKTANMFERSVLEWCPHLEQVLVGEVVSWVELKYEDVVDSCLPPSVRVDP